MRARIALLGAVLALAAAAVPSHVRAAEKPGDPYPLGIRGKATPAVMARYDLDRNGILDTAEKAALRRDIAEKVEPIRRSMLAQYDWNKNGRLDADESAAMRAARAEQHARSEARALRHFDANHDGTLDPGEQAVRRERRESWVEQKRAQALLAFDANGNGLLDPAEKSVMRAKVAEGRSLALQMFDENRDGRLDASERALATETELVDRTGRLSRSGAAPLSATTGGEARSDGGGAKLSVPAGALQSDARVEVTTATSKVEPREGDHRILAVYDVTWAGTALRKPATLELSYAVVAGSVVESNLRIGRWDGDSWQDVGGTATPATRRVSTAVTQPGRYALIEWASAKPGVATVTDVRFVVTRTAGTGVDIAFTLGAPGVVTVKIFDTAGRLVRIAARRVSLPAGPQTVSWDGRSSDGSGAANGVYLVRVEGPSNSVTRKLSLLR